ncbi:MAG TPA: aminotransferase class V-fold PLP-dependent enzyme [Ramlibacter sp.]|nr:aminotransferase class V-fold PLP-dependent enzyme [Ramlibacter sp.]
MTHDVPPPPCPELFPMLRERTYLDTGSAGLSFPAQARAAAFYEDKQAAYLGRERWQQRAAAVRARLAAWLQVPPEEIDFFSGTTDALNIVGHSLPWRAGDEIVAAEDEFPSVRLAWRAAEQAGAVVRRIAVAREATREDDLLQALTPRTRVLVAAHVHSITGTRLNLDRLGAACRERDCLFVVDGIHALGATPAPLENVDVYASGVFKWLLAGFGLAVCVVRGRARRHLQPAFRGYLNQPPETALQFAHVNYPALYVLDASLQLLGETIGWEQVQWRTSQLVERLAAALQARELELAAPPGARAGIASFAVPDAEALRIRLAQERIHVAARGRYLRASPFFYNSAEDVDRLADAVRRMA